MAAGVGSIHNALICDPGSSEQATEIPAADSSLWLHSFFLLPRSNDSASN
jgi:hypothetical protein